jgi:hypothetical protein
MSRLLSWLAPLLAVFFGMTASASPTQLIRPDAVWRYLALSEGGPPEGWEGESFDDASWAPGPAGLSVGYSGYLQGATVIPSWTGRGYVRGLAMRHRFRVEDPGRIHTLVLRLEYEDGCILWLNGREVARLGVAAGPVPRWDSLAAVHGMGAAELVDLSAHLPKLRAGTNLLAIQAFDGSTFGASLYVWPELRANFSRGPLVQNVSSNRLTVAWQTLAPTAGRVELRRDPEEGWQRLGRMPGATDQAAEIEGLQPGTRYEYRVVLEGVAGDSASEPATVRTLRTHGDIEFLALGDTGASTTGQYGVASALFREPADLVLHLGDIAYPGLTRGRLDLRCFGEYEPSFRSVPWFFTFGNHDVYNGEEAYLEAFRLPRNPLTGGSQFYSFDHGDAHFVSLFIPWWGLSGIGAVGADGGRSAQYRWLTNDLATTSKPWKIVFFHQPPHTSGPHFYDDYDVDGRRDSEQMKEALVPLLARLGVQVVFNGHDHNWERFAPTNGVHFVVSGGGGAYLYTRSYPDVGSAQFASRHHFTRARIQGDTLTVEAVGEEGGVFDRFSIRIGSQGTRSLEAPWIESPDRSPGPPNGDGNTLGETFDLPGKGWPATTLGTANLGSLIAGVDARGLRLGLRDLMIWPEQTVVLLMGAESSTGVAQLPDAGANTLHPLRSVRLAFPEDRPSMVALLGDELADGNFPGWTRPGTGTAVGQGVYRLDASFSEVAGAALRQFNRSPEVGGVPVEQNADFAVVSLPWGAMPGVSPGDTISVRAVVVTASRGERALPLALEESYLGVDWSRNAEGVVTLGALRIRLASEPEGPGEAAGPVLVARRVADGVSLSWSTRVGRRYELEACEQLPGTFQPLPVPGFPRRALSDMESVTVPGRSSQAWYRVRELP